MLVRDGAGDPRPQGDVRARRAGGVSIRYRLRTPEWRMLFDGVRAALRRSPDVLGAAANARAASEAYQQAAAGRYPTVDLRLGEGKENSETPGLRAAGVGSNTLTRQEANLTLRQNLYDGSQVKSEMERQQFRFESARSRLSETAETVALRTADGSSDYVTLTTVRVE